MEDVAARSPNQPIEIEIECTVVSEPSTAKQEKKKGGDTLQHYIYETYRTTAVTIIK